MEKPKKKTLSQIWDEEFDRIQKFKSKGREEGIVYITKEPPKPQEVTQKHIDDLRRITPETSKSVKYRSSEEIDLYTPSNAITLETGGASYGGTVDAGVGIRHGRLPTKSDEEKEFTALRNRLKRRVEGAEKRGYIFDDTTKDLINSDYSESGLSNLREILDKDHPENLYRTSYKEDKQGELTAGITAYNRERAKGLLEYQAEQTAFAVDRMDYVFEEAFKHGGTLAPLIRNQLRMATQELGKEKLYVHLYRLGEEFINFMTWLITYEAKNVGSLFRSYAYLSSAIKGDKHPSEAHDFENTADEFYTFINSPEYQDYLAELEGVEDEQ